MLWTTKRVTTTARCQPEAGVKHACGGARATHHAQRLLVAGDERARHALPGAAEHLHGRLWQVGARCHAQHFRP